MATVRSQDVNCRIVKDGTLELETKAGHTPNYNGIVVIEDKLLVVDYDESNLQLLNRHDGKLITLHRLESRPTDVCLITKTEVAMCLVDGTVVIMSMKSKDDVKLVKTLRTRFIECLSLAKLNSDKLVVSGLKYDGMMNWGILSITNGHLDPSHVICQGNLTHMAIKDNTLYISCLTGDSIANGVYAYDIFNPDKIRFLYRHQELKTPGSIMTNKDCVYVCDRHSNKIHQLTYSGQLVTIHTVSSSLDKIFYDDQHGVLCTTSLRSNVITVYKMESLHQPDSEQDYKLQHLVLNENYQTGERQIDSEPDATSNQRETTDGNPLSHDADDNKNTEVLNRQQQNVDQTLSSTSSLQKGIPMEILKMDDRSIQLFEEALKHGKETVHSIRIMVVGHMGVGKTTLVKRLLGEEVNISERHSTEGIDVYVNCCDVSLSTHEWTRRTKDSGQDYQLQRIVKVLNEQHSVAGKVSEEIVLKPSEEDRTESLEHIHAADKDRKAEVLNHFSEKDFDQDLSSATNQQEESTAHKQEESTAHEQKESTAHQQEENIAHQPEESSSAVFEKKSTLSKTNMIAMIKLLKENINKIEGTGETSYLTIWDFAGQYAFYTTHQTFLTRRAIYLLVSDVSGQVTDLVADDCYFDSKGIMKCQVHELVEVWLNSIHSCASSPEADSPPVILVGTHVDKISQYLVRQKRSTQLLAIVTWLRPNPKLEGKNHEICKRYFREIRSYLKDKPTRFHLIDEDFAIDNTVVDKTLEDLKRKIVEVASQQPYWGEKIPARWIPLEQELMRRKAAGEKVISHEDVEKINKEGTVQIENSEELDLFLRFLHETGTIIYFSIDILRDNIVLDPSWLIDALKTLINAQPDLPEGTADNVVSQKWSDFKGKGILSSELIDAVWTKEKYPELHANKAHMLLIMEQLNIIAKPRAFSEIGEKIESYFLTPCMLRQESPREITSTEQDPLLVSTPVLCFVFTGMFLPPPIFHRLIAACVTRWPVAKNKETSENLIFCGCCIFNLDLFHRLTLHCKNHIVFARITRLVVDEVKTPDEMLCTRVRKFIKLNLSKISSYLSQNLKYELCTWWSPSQVVSEDGSAAPCQMWFADEGHDSDASIMPEHMNHARLYVALVTVCTNALREILLTHVPKPHANIYQAIRAKKADLTKKTQTRRGQWQNALLLLDQCQVVFPDPFGRYVASVDQFDISLLYILIRNVSTVSASKMDWGIDPIEKPVRDTCLGASVERIRSYRNQIGHSMDGQINQHDFDDYWNKLDAVLDDIEQALGRQGYRAELEKQRRQVISVYEAC